ncbi:Basic 7S globulin 2 [Dichanthelium oligosanthes]|uniref:Basic 7S globulin 2 n=1 Tax=Dichanthelium oligosanthes TaxID=888268 RepID=A0A1E5WDH5_9POAL|nr:Basic 7S globulin 2 [Dichanthelium oligosanthes]
MLRLLVPLLLLLSPPAPGTVLLAAAYGRPPSKPIVTPVAKDPLTSLYSIPIKDGAPLVLDLAGPLVWSTCQPSHATIPCKSSVCKLASSYRPPGCTNSRNGGRPGPGSSSADGDCTCTAYPYNPASGQCGVGDVTAVALSANATDGKNPLFPVSFSTYASCAPDGLLASLPSGAAGVAGLSRLPLSLPSQVASSLGVSKQFALCITGARGGGAAIFGGGPFQLMARHELAEGLRKNALPLLQNPSNAGAYYLRVQGIAIGEAAVTGIPPGAFDLDVRRGTGGVTLSTVAPYTTLRADIYAPLREAFAAATSGVPRAPPVEPFEMCYPASAFGATRLGPAVAYIDLMLDGGRNWTLPGASSLVQVDDQTLCFAFLEMDRSAAAVVPGSPAVIVGGFQMEENLLVFDPEKSTFGFSGLLFGIETTCGNFNFTVGSS